VKHVLTALLLAAADLGASNTAVSAQGSPASLTSADGANVRGRVLAADGDAPLRNVRVTLTQLDGTSQTVLSDPEGRFVFSAVRSGIYAVAAAKPGFVPTRSSARLSLAPSASVEGIDDRRRPCRCGQPE
jgi:hypothetical protein